MAAPTVDPAARLPTTSSTEPRPGSWGLLRGSIEFGDYPCRKYLERGGALFVLACDQLVQVRCDGRFVVPLPARRCDVVALHVDANGLLASGPVRQVLAPREGGVVEVAVASPDPTDYAAIEEFVEASWNTLRHLRDLCEYAGGASPVLRVELRSRGRTDGLARGECGPPAPPRRRRHAAPLTSPGREAAAGQQRLAAGQDGTETAIQHGRITLVADFRLKS